MNIVEATKLAIEKNTLMYRREAKLSIAQVYAAIKPGNTYDTCILIVFDRGKSQRSSRCWNPTADDLMAEDWEVVDSRDLQGEHEADDIDAAVAEFIKL